MKTIISFCLMLCSVLLVAQKKLTFEKLSDMSNEAFAFGYSASDQDIFALTGGDDVSKYTTFLQTYDSRFDFWMATPIKDLPLMNYSSAAYMEAYDGLLILGGTQPYGSSVALVDKIRMLNLEDQTISILGPLPEPAKNMGLAIEGSKAYFFGGSKSMFRNSLGSVSYECSNKLFVYDLKVGHLEMLPDMPQAMETKGGIANGKLYTFGGFDGNARSDVWQYDIEARSWTKLPSLEKPVSAYALAQYEHYFILVGDYYDANQLIVYNTETHAAEYFKMNVAGRHMGASVIGSDLYIYGGVNGQLQQPNGFVKSELYKIGVRELIKSLEQ
ncbi:Kelch repeat-containing protein [Roseivirga sp.]|uniref:Kelch repeat-containing protein n=1 Tax=Roseivirga sp. TaxID=1964215 RepID=UPI003B526868